MPGPACPATHVGGEDGVEASAYVGEGLREKRRNRIGSRVRHGRDGTHGRADPDAIERVWGLRSET